MRFRLELSCTRTDAHTITQINNTWYHFMARQRLFNWGRHWAEGEQCQLFGDILARVTTRAKEFADALGSGKQQQQILWQRLAKQEKTCRGHGLIVPGAEVWDSQASPYHRHSVIKGARLCEKTFCWRRLRPPATPLIFGQEVSAHDWMWSGLKTILLKRGLFLKNKYKTKVYHIQAFAKVVNTMLIKLIIFNCIPVFLD